MTYNPRKHRPHKYKPLTSYTPLMASLDDYCALGVTYHYVGEDGTPRQAPNLDAVEGAAITIRVIYRCHACGHVAAWVEDFVAATGPRVVRFVGRVYADAPSWRSEEGELAGYTSFAYLNPSFGTAPRCACPKHGALLVAMEQVAADVLLSMKLQAGGAARRDASRSSTVRGTLRPDSLPG